MPGMSGTELSGHAIALRPGLDVVYMTAYAQEHLSALANSAVVIRKPFTPERLLETIRRHLDQHPPTRTGQARSTRSRGGM